MLGVILLTAAAIWILGFALVLGLCRDAKAGDDALDFACGRISVRDRDGALI